MCQQSKTSNHRHPEVCVYIYIEYGDFQTSSSEYGQTFHFLTSPG